MTATRSRRPTSLERRIAIRVVLLILAGISLYLLAPSLLQIFSSWPELRELNPLWLGLAVLFEAMSSLAFWTLQRIALRTRSWFAVGTSQLASGAFGRVVPGGSAAASALQFSMLVRSGIPAQTVASGLAASWAATTATVLALPVVAVVNAIGGTAVPHGLRNVAYLGGGAFFLLVAAGVAAFAWDRPLRLVGRGVAAAMGLIGRRDRAEGLPDRLLQQRDALRRAFASRPWLAVLAAIGKWGFDYAALLCVLAALSLEPDPALVLLAYAASSILGMIPLTPGGLGFVEAGLAALLVLAGVNAGDAAVATLAYRLVSFWLPLPAGVVAWWLARRRYGPPAPEVSAASTSSSSSDAATSPP
ncbi:MAG TPA: YbhN family protein [Gaiellaceae bacterium]|nr:YbhN family protein [Gaiellaceae bacterium]